MPIQERDFGDVASHASSALGQPDTALHAFKGLEPAGEHLCCCAIDGQMEYVDVDASIKCRDADLQEHSSEVTRSPAEGMPVEHALEPSHKRHKASRFKRSQNVGLLPVKSS